MDALLREVGRLFLMFFGYPEASMGLRDGGTRVTLGASSVPGLVAITRQASPGRALPVRLS